MAFEYVVIELRATVKLLEMTKSKYDRLGRRVLKYI